ncbi:Protein of unknown function [Gryllus bimaculatus]|nr:Protein of unknown function [Gryllus bimaculatus]
MKFATCMTPLHLCLRSPPVSVKVAYSSLNQVGQVNRTLKCILSKKDFSHFSSYGRLEPYSTCTYLSSS